MRRSRSEWEKIVAEYEASDEQHVEFCARRKVSLHSFRTWLYQLRKERAAGRVARSATKAVQMVPVRVREALPIVAPDDVVEVVVRGALVRVRIDAVARLHHRERDVGDVRIVSSVLGLSLLLQRAEIGRNARVEAQVAGVRRAPQVLRRAPREFDAVDLAVPAASGCPWVVELEPAEDGDVRSNRRRIHSNSSTTAGE